MGNEHCPGTKTLPEQGKEKEQIILIYIASLFILIILGCYFYVVYDQYRYTRQHPYFERLTILSTRACFIFPGFALSYYGTIFAPFYMYNLAQVPTAFIQAYCIFCFFGYMVYYVGGPDNVVQIFSNTTRFGPCNLFSNIIQINNKGIPWSKIWYYRTYSAVWSFMFLRPYVVMLTVIFFFIPCAELPNQRLAKLYYLTGVFSLIGTGFVFIAIMSVFKTFHIVYDYCAGSNSFWKLFILKGVVGLILGEGFLEQVYYATKGYHSPGWKDDDSRQDDKDPNNILFLQNIQDSKTYEIFVCFLLGELAILSLLMCPIFTTRINLNEVKDGLNLTLRKMSESPIVSSLSFSGYIYKLMKVWDLFEDDVFFLSSDLGERTSTGMELGSNLTISILHQSNLQDNSREDVHDDVHQDVLVDVHEDLDAPRFG